MLHLMAWLITDCTEWNSWITVNIELERKMAKKDTEGGWRGVTETTILEYEWRD
jgi:hypothetical protein